MPVNVDPYSKPRPFPELREALRDLADIEVSTATLYRLARRGELPVSEVGGRKRSTVQAYLNATIPAAGAVRAA